MYNTILNSSKNIFHRIFKVLRDDTRSAIGQQADDQDPQPEGACTQVCKHKGSKAKVPAPEGTEGASHLQVQAPYSTGGAKRRRGRPRKIDGPSPKNNKMPQPAKRPKPPDLLPRGSNTHGDLRFNIEIDAEWYTPEFQGRPPITRPPIFITLQIAQFKGPKKLKRIFQHPQFTQFSRKEDLQGTLYRPTSDFNTPMPATSEKYQWGPPTWVGETPIPDLLGPVFSQRSPRPDEKLEHYSKLRLTLTIFYSFADVVAFLGHRLSLVLVEQLRTGKAIRVGPGRWAPLPHVISETMPDGSVIDRQVVVQIRDLFGLEYESLQKTAYAYNIPMPHKGVMDDYKDKMHIAYNDPELRPKMIDYAIGDLILADLWDAYQRNYSQLCAIFGVEPQLPPPATKGALVAHLFKQVLDSTVKLPEDFHRIFDLPSRKALASITHLLREYGCKNLAKSDDSQTKQFLSIVHGGRVNNECPEVVRQQGLVISMDMVSCYGQALEHLSIPIGHPALFYNPHHKPDQWQTLGDFLDLYRHELVEGCWYAVVDTCGEQLSFPQNILYSKSFDGDLPNIFEDAKLSDDWSEDLAHVKGDFMLLENEVRNGIITHYSLSVLEHCASSQDKSEVFKKLRVKAAMVYPKSLCIEYKGPESVDEWIEASRNHTGKLETWGNLKEHGMRDSRVGPWLKYPLGTFISPLLEKRRSLKAQMKKHSTDSEEWRRLNAAQLSVKKVVNTLYGTLASIYFPISSPCVANNVTDRARTACWLMSIAGAGLTSITDGCESLLNQLRFWKEKPPSLATAARLHQPNLLSDRTRRRHWTAPLGSGGDPNQSWNYDHDGMITGPGIDKPVNTDTVIKHIESMYDQHFRRYFTFGEKSLPTWCDTLKFECKLIGMNIALHGSADYAIGRLPFENRPPLIKARGHRLKAIHYHPETGKPVEAPMLLMMSNRLDGEPMPTRQIAQHYKPASVREFLTRREFRERGGLPGHSISKYSRVRLITLTEFNFPNLDTRLKWQQYYEYLSRRYGLGLEAAYLGAAHTGAQHQDSTDSLMTCEQLTRAKVDIQRRIYAQQSPGERRVSTSVRTLKQLGSPDIEPDNMVDDGVDGHD